MNKHFEDMPEFKELSPALQEQVLAATKRLRPYEWVYNQRGERVGRIVQMEDGFWQLDRVLQMSDGDKYHVKVPLETPREITLSCK